VKLLFNQRPVSSTSPIYDLSEFFPRVGPILELGNWTSGKVGEFGSWGKRGKGDIPCGEDISFVCCNESTALLNSYKSA
jgi:hypothetical protein